MVRMYFDTGIYIPRLTCFTDRREHIVAQSRTLYRYLIYELFASFLRLICSHERLVRFVGRIHFVC